MKSMVLLVLGLFIWMQPPSPAAASDKDNAPVAATATDMSAQSRPRRPRTRVYVYPGRQPPAWDYPRPGDVSWPGPGALRDCVARLEPEYRLSGTVIVPRTYCRWVRG